MFDFLFTSPHPHLIPHLTVEVRASVGRVEEGVQVAALRGKLEVRLMNNVSLALTPTTPLYLAKPGLCGLVRKLLGGKLVREAG